MTTVCAMCAAADCVQLRAQPLDACPVYYRLRDAVLPGGGDLPGAVALTLFWLAKQLGALERGERMRLAAELANLFTFARLDAYNSHGHEVH